MIHSLIYRLKEEDSELWFVKYKLHITSIGQSTHQDLVQKCGLRRNLFDKSCLRRILFFKNLAYGAFFSYKFFLNLLGCIWFEVSYSVYQFIGGENDSNSNTEWSQRHNLYQTVIRKVSDNKPFVKSNLSRFKSHSTISIPKQFIRNNIRRGNALPKAYRFWRDQALRLLCLKGHVRARGSTLWRHRWQEASESLCTKKTSIWKEFINQKNGQKTDALRMSRFQNFAADAAKNRLSRGFIKFINSKEFWAKDSEKLFSSLVPSFPLGSPSWTDVRFTCHHDTAFVMHMILQQVLSIVLPSGNHLYSCPKSISNDVFLVKKARINLVQD